MIASIVPIVRKTWDDRGDHMETLSSAIPVIGTIEAIAIARIAQVLSQTIRAIGAIKDFLMETIPSDRGDPNITRSCRERHDSCQNVLKVAADNEFSLELFTEEVQIYDCIKQIQQGVWGKYERINCWKKIGGKFSLSTEEAEKLIQEHLDGLWSIPEAHVAVEEPQE